MGGTTQWFRQIIPFAPSKQGASKSVNVSNFTLNDVIPKATFIVYDGGTFDWGCSKNDVMILFTLDNAVNILYKDLRTLGNIIKKHSYNVLSISYLKLTKKNFGGIRKNRSSKSSTLTCTPILDQDGKNIENPDNQHG